MKAESKPRSILVVARPVYRFPDIYRPQSPLNGIQHMHLVSCIDQLHIEKTTALVQPLWCLITSSQVTQPHADHDGHVVFTTFG